ncbi:MAG TPA: aminopeptidase P family protein [Patescibacteria group bacterium]|jgi:Xaa-Pro aminopeptidase|nr:aminopeptidase P family protein [Patescibacteria group bacterium]
MSRAAINRIQNFLTAKKLDAFLVLTKTNRQYLSGFSGSSGSLLITRNEILLFVDGRYTLRAKKESSVAVKELSALASWVNKNRIKKIGIEDRITLAQFKFIKSQHVARQWTVTHDLIENLRAQKQTFERNAIAKGSRIIDQTFWFVKKLVSQKPGLTEADLAFQIEKFGKDKGADEVAFDSIVAFGPNAAAPHHLASKQKIGRNNFLLLDFGMKVTGYHSDFTRTLFIGIPNSAQAKIYETVLQAQKLALAKVKIGQRASAVDKAARDHITKAGFGKLFTHNTGHGVGLEIHELPNFSPNSDAVLKKDMVVTVEPGIYVAGKGGVRIEDMIQVGKNSVLSEIPTDFKSMLIK